MISRLEGAGCQLPHTLVFLAVSYVNTHVREALSSFIPRDFGLRPSLSHSFLFTPIPFQLISSEIAVPFKAGFSTRHAHTRTASWNCCVFSRKPEVKDTHLPDTAACVFYLSRAPDSKPGQQFVPREKKGIPLAIYKIIRSTPLFANGLWMASRRGERWHNDSQLNLEDVISVHDRYLRHYKYTTLLGASDSASSMSYITQGTSVSG